jgi:hypothetical protein
MDKMDCRAALLFLVPRVTYELPVARHQLAQKFTPIFHAQILKQKVDSMGLLDKVIETLAAF